ncbi:hypothetical protein B0A55_10369 [Friedmanniomyces simplex]|uniref:Aminoglycoside phosphotransferase domain-containing protein n=1 Tax=Friedmanniomyces simplex TaxID=329884 RepID=A0A4U0W1F9_9PEZI|nr:hypothetical protein B0A55_10369 [Friedmanniomyces simplex]
MAVEASRIYSPLAPGTEELGQLAIGGEGGGRQCLQALSLPCVPGERFSEIQPRTPTLDQRTLDRSNVLMGSLSDFFAMQWRVGKWLASLETYLPTEALRQRARWTRERVQEGALNELPVVLTHGDLVPSNIMVCAETWRIQGYVDWAEAEYLPYSLCFYGLEHLLGYLKHSGGKKPRFVYYSQAEELRATFWEALDHQVPEVASGGVRHR